MANPFTVNVPNALEALMAGEQGYRDMRGFADERTKRAVREEAAQSIMQGGDARGALARLLSIGDVQGANTLANLEESAQNRAFRQQESQRAQQNADRSFGLQERQFGQSAARDARDFAYRQEEAKRAQANADRSYGLQVQQANKPQYQIVEDASGGKQIVQLSPGGGASVVTPQGGSPQQPANPFSTGKFNEVQGKSATFVDRMAKAHEVINSTENINDGVTGFIGGVAANDPRMRDSAMVNRQFSPERQMSIQAQRDFINATLRRESGAAISPSEFENGQRQYFPQPGDSKEVIAQKRENRLTVMRGFAREAGPAYQPPASILPGSAPATDAKPAPQKRLRFNPATGTLE